MTRIDVRRLIIGGLAAGAVANVFDFVIVTYFLAGDVTDMMTRLNLSTADIESSIWKFAIVDFVWGLLLVFTYVSIRPRFGPGPGTAVVSGVVLWLAISLLETQIMIMGIVTAQYYFKGAALYLLSAVVSSLVGAALYKDRDETD